MVLLIMPWTASSAKRFSKKAGGNKTTSRQWSAVANDVLDKTGDEGKAIRIASGVVKKRYKSISKGVSK